LWKGSPRSSPNGCRSVSRLATDRCSGSGQSFECQCDQRSGIQSVLRQSMDGATGRPTVGCNQRLLACRAMVQVGILVVVLLKRATSLALVAPSLSDVVPDCTFGLQPSRRSLVPLSVMPWSAGLGVVPCSMEFRALRLAKKIFPTLWCNRLHCSESREFEPVGRPVDGCLSIRSNRRRPGRLPGAMRSAQLLSEALGWVLRVCCLRSPLSPPSGET